MPSTFGLIQLRPRPGTISVSRGFAALIMGLDGQVVSNEGQGLFVHETRMLSDYVWRVDGEPLVPVALSKVEEHDWLGYYVRELPGNQKGGDDHGSGMMRPESEYTLELRVRRTVAAGVREQVQLTNFTIQRTTFDLELAVDADFADLQETKGARQQSGEYTRRWSPDSRTLTLAYQASHRYEHEGERGSGEVDRSLDVRVHSSSSPVEYDASGAGSCLRFRVELPPGGRWSAELHLVPQVEPLDLLEGGTGTDFEESFEVWDERDRAFAEEAAAVVTPGVDTLAGDVFATLNRAKRDLAALRLHDLDLHERAWVAAAGLPIYLALYGRDTLTAGWQAAVLGPQMLEGALGVLGRRQGTRDIAWRDEQPGRMLHEMHTGPLKVMGHNPSGRNYGSLTTSAFYPVAATELWHWVGDRDLSFYCLPTVLENLDWLDRRGDLNGDGFYEYLTRSDQGVRHQGWKDSPDAVVDHRGQQVEPPIAPCEEQGFVYQAKYLYAETLWQLGNRDEARRLFDEARALRERFNDVFWMEEEGFYAMGLDAEGRQIRAITSNVGHLLATGIVPRERALTVADRLFESDLFSGWGIRTLSARNPAFNPYSYHRGGVWPVEHGTFALGLMRYGLFDHLHRLMRAQFEAATLFHHHRLPEVFSGHERNDRQPFPAFYPQANSPQAWSASAVYCGMQAMLGLYPYAPLKLLVVDPHLPEWLPEVTLRRLRVGTAQVTIRFYRNRDGSSSYRIEEREGTLHVVRQPSPWSLTAGRGERLVDALQSLLPGR